MNLQVSFYIPSPNQTFKLLSDWECDLERYLVPSAVAEINGYKECTFSEQKGWFNYIFVEKDFYKEVKKNSKGLSKEQADEFKNEQYKENRDKWKENLTVNFPAGTRFKIHKMDIKGKVNFARSEFELTILEHPQQNKFPGLIGSIIHVKIPEFNKIFCEVDEKPFVVKKKKKK